MSDYLCEHDEEGIELLIHDDELLPTHMEIRECPECGMWAEYDTEDNQYRTTA